MIRKIITIDEDKCNGCGNCIPNCPEGALQIIDNKARLVSDLFCDGLGACIGHCPQGAIQVMEREAEPYDESKVMENIVKQGENTILAHLKHLKEHGADDFYEEAVKYLEDNGLDVPTCESCEDHESDTEEPEPLACGCPGSMLKEVKKEETKFDGERPSELRQWPVQLNLLTAQAPFFKNADLLIAADCTAYACGDFHSLIKDKAIAIGCPKFDDIEAYKERLTSILRDNDIKSVTVAIMEVPCCSGFIGLAKEAIKMSGRYLQIKKIVIDIKGKIKEEDLL